jgi:hypothetical protein
MEAGASIFPRQAPDVEGAPWRPAGTARYPRQAEAPNIGLGPYSAHGPRILAGTPDQVARVSKLLTWFCCLLFILLLFLLLFIYRYFLFFYFFIFLFFYFLFFIIIFITIILIVFSTELFKWWG